MQQIKNMSEKNYKTIYTSPVGKITIVCDEKENIAGLWIEGQKYFLSTVKSEMIEKNELKVFKKTKDWLDRYFRGEKPDIKELPLKPKGSDFRKEVWKILCKIPYGEVITYGEIAAIIAKKRGMKKLSAQAVGGAVGHNPISIIIPCHRVIGKNGNLTGYSGGIETKIKLLKLEGINSKLLSLP